jgi:hypothetical protein
MSLKIDMTFLMSGKEQMNFTPKLLQLIFKTYAVNNHKLSKGFPNAVKTVNHYKAIGEILDLPDD